MFFLSNYDFGYYIINNVFFVYFKLEFFVGNFGNSFVGGLYGGFNNVKIDILRVFLNIYVRF